MSTVFISEEANALLKTYLQEKGHHLIAVRRTPFVYDAIAAHPDIYLCRLKESLVIAGEQFPLIKSALASLQEPPSIGADAGCNKMLRICLGESVLGPRYPENIKYNAARIGKYFIHNTMYTDPVLRQAAAAEGLAFLHVKQGYTKCSLAVVDDESAITSDVGMAKSLYAKGLNILLISPGHVALPGFPYGFIGGTCGRVGQELIFHGDISLHPDFKAMKDFVESRHVTLKYFTEFPLTDIGSIIER